jgi:hypothetical protein
MKIIVEEIVVPGKRDKEKMCKIVLTTAEQKKQNFRQIHALVIETAKRELQAERLENLGIVCSPTSSVFSFRKKEERIILC